MVCKDCYSCMYVIYDALYAPIKPVECFATWSLLQISRQFEIQTFCHLSPEVTHLEQGMLKRKVENGIASRTPWLNLYVLGIEMQSVSFRSS